MRYLTVRLRPADGAAFHPLGEALTEDPAVTREAIHHVELLTDGTALLLGEASGDRGRYRELVRDSSSVLDSVVSEGDRWMAVTRFEPTERVRRALELERESDIVVETPIHVDGDGSFRVTYLGSDAAFRSVFHAVGDEADLAFDVVDTGTYDPDAASFARTLTARQQEVLDAAVDVGYYRAPRQATLEDVATRVGVAPTTAGEHLRKIEARVFEALAR